MKKIVALLFALFIALTGLSGIAFADVEADPVIEDPEPANTAAADIVFTIVGESEYYNWLFLPQWIPVTDAALLEGVTAVDENGDPVTVTVANVGGLDLSSPQPAEGFPPAPYVITYQAIHPVTGVVYTVTRDAFVTIGTQPTALPPPDASLMVNTGTGPTSAYSSGSLIQQPPPPSPPTPGTLAPGEVLVGKSIVYNQEVPANLANPYDGTITVTLYAWAATYIDDSGVVTNPLLQMSGGDYIQITDDIGEFAIVEPITDLNALGLSVDPNTGTITWDIMSQTPSDILGTAPYTVTYTLTVDNPGPQFLSQTGQPPYLLDYWYSTGIANAQFQPAVGNPYYYTMEETTVDAFVMSMNWNNGNGLNSGSITDNELKLSIIFPANVSAQNLKAYNADGTMNLAGGWNWWPQNANTRNQAATQVGSTNAYSWQLQWVQASPGTPKVYIFTVKDLAGPGLDVQYVVDFPNGGGSQAFAGDKIVVSTDYFPKKVNSSASDPFYWVPAQPAPMPPIPVINVPIDVYGEIMLADIPPETFDLTIDKTLTGYSADWGVGNDTEFMAYITFISNTTGLTYYVVLNETSPGTYEYFGFTLRKIPILFSVNTPAVITGMPTEDGNGDPLLYTVTEDPSWMSNMPEPAGIAYEVDGVPVDDAEVPPDPANPADLATVTVINNFPPLPPFELRLMKLFDGYPSDWGITTSTEFNVMIYDVTAGNYKLFVSPDTANEAPIATPSNVPNRGPATSYYCVGTFDGTDLASATYINVYWTNYLTANPGSILTSLPIFDLKQTWISNLPASTYAVQELDFSGNLLSVSNPPWWQAYYYFIDFDRMGPSVSNPVTLFPGTSYIGYVTNFFQHGQSNISVFKQIVGTAEALGDWGVDENTEFNIRVWDMTNNVYLLFDPIMQPDGSYWHMGSMDTSGNRFLDDPSYTYADLAAAIYEVPLSVNSPVVFSNIYTGSGHHYMIEETGPPAGSVHFITGSQDITNDGPTGGIVVVPDENMNLTIVNAYMPKNEGTVMIYKHLAGNWVQAGVNDSTEFTFKIINEMSSRTLLFEQSGVGVYQVAGEMASDGTVYDVVWNPVTDTADFVVMVPQPDIAAEGWISDLPLSVKQQITINEFIPGTYRLIETYFTPAGYTVSYSVSDPILIEGLDVLGVTVTNTYLQIPDNPGPGGGGGGGGGGGNSGTGDYRNIEGWTTSLLLSSLGLICILAWARRQFFRPKYLKNRFVAQKVYPKA